MDLSISKVGAGDQGMFVCIMRDITGRKQAEENIRTLNEELAGKVEQLVAAQEELMRNEKLAMLGQIAAAMANELRNPLGVMSNAIFFLESIHADDDEIVGEYLKIFKDEIDNSQRIVSDLLDFSGSNAQKAELIVFEQFISMWLGKCAIPENIRLEIDLPETTLIRVKIDAKQLEEVLRNLVSNAIQAMPDGGSLRVAARQILNSELRIMSSDDKIQNSKFDGDFVEISISDSGVGIAPENMPKLFQPLFTTKARGIGLGLAIAQKLVEANGGRIGVESTPGKGTTFVVTLPVISETHARREAP
jgi:signal transduction histidine kinase